MDLDGKWVNIVLQIVQKGSNHLSRSPVVTLKRLKRMMIQDQNQTLGVKNGVQIRRLTKFSKRMKSGAASNRVESPKLVKWEKGIPNDKKWRILFRNTSFEWIDEDPLI